MEDNPFAGYGTTVKGNAFIGRKIEIKLIQQRLFSGEFGNVSIVGLPKIGKSSLMYQALIFKKEDLWSSKKILPIWMSLKSYASPGEFYLKLVLSVFSEIKSRVTDEVLIRSLQECLEELKKKDLSFVETEHYLLSFFSDIVSAEIRIIACLDEFDYAKEVFGEVHYQLLRTLSYEPDHQIGFITTSRRNIYDIERYSGQGSNFFGTFENIRLAVLNGEDAAELFAKASGVTEQEITRIKYYTGNHAYLISMVLYKYVQSGASPVNLTTVLDEARIDILKYFDDVFYVLDKDNLADKLIRIYSGIYDGVSQAEQEYLLKYGLYIQTEQRNWVPFSAFFDDYLNLKWREAPFKLIWPEAERCLKRVITECVNEIYGDDWEEYIQDDLPSSNIPEDQDLIRALRIRKSKERQSFGTRASNNLIDQLYPRHYPMFIELHWDEFYKDVFGNDLTYWLNKLNFISRKVRNPESHSRFGLLTDAELREASIVSTEIIDKVENWFN